MNQIIMHWQVMDDEVSTPHTVDGLVNRKKCLTEYFPVFSHWNRIESFDGANVIRGTESDDVSQRFSKPFSNMLSSLAM